MRRKAFTLIELIVALAIIAVLIGMLLPAIESAKQRARKTAAISDMDSLSTALTIDYSNTRKYPKYLFQVECGVNKRYRFGESPIPFVYTDPWGMPYWYVVPYNEIQVYDRRQQVVLMTCFTNNIGMYTKHGKNLGRFQIFSSGPDKMLGGGGEWTPGVGAWSPGQPGFDDLSNFNGNNLGQNEFNHAWGNAR